jgi:hypothetical protein
MILAGEYVTDDDDQWEESQGSKTKLDPAPMPQPLQSKVLPTNKFLPGKVNTDLLVNDMETPA